MTALLVVTAVVIVVAAAVATWRLGYRAGYQARMRDDGRLCLACAWKDARMVDIDEEATTLARFILGSRRHRQEP